MQTLQCIVPLPFSQPLLENVWAQKQSAEGEMGGVSPRQFIYMSDWDAR